jgi:hypothetical protein
MPAGRVGTGIEGSNNFLFVGGAAGLIAIVASILIPLIFTTS